MNKCIVIGNNQEWCYYSWKAVENSERICFYNGIDDILRNHFMGLMCRKHFGFRQASRKPYPFRRIWYRILLKSLKLDKGQESTIIFYDWGPLSKDMSFINYLRKQLPKTKLVYLFSNVISISGAVKYNTLDHLKKHFDQIFAFDPGDAIKYGFDFSPLIYTRDPSYKENEKCYDVFYVGNAKDRLDTLHEIYKRCIDANLSCCFYINGVPPEKQLFQEIHYNHPLSYQEVLNFISTSRCMVDAIQGGSSAMTIKVCESVIYDKKLITTNEAIKQEPYYSHHRILVYHSNSDLMSFVNESCPQFSESEKRIFSPEALFEKIK